MQTTIETTPTDAEYERRLGRTLWLRTKPYLDAAQAAEAKDAEVGERMAHARETPIAKCQAREALVQQAIDNMRAQLEGEVSTNRVHKVLEHLRIKKDVLGYQYAKLPTRKVVKRVLKANGL